MSNQDHKFKVGDRIRKISLPGATVPIGSVGTVVCHQGIYTLVRVDGGPTAWSIEEQHWELLVDQPAPWDTQVGGDHYKKVEGYQPFQISHACGLNPIEHTVLKYLLRHRRKGGADDLRKAQHCLDLLIEQEYKCIPT